LGISWSSNLDSRKARRLDHVDRAVQMHRIAPSARAVEDERQAGDGADVDPDAHHFGQRQVGLGDALDIAEAAAAQVQRGEARGLGELRANRIEDDRRFDERRGAYHFTQACHSVSLTAPISRAVRRSG
jgi:hypothetical protein